MSHCRPGVVRRSPEGLGLHWLHGESADPPPERFAQPGSGAVCAPCARQRGVARSSPAARAWAAGGVQLRSAAGVGFGHARHHAMATPARRPGIAVSQVHPPGPRAADVAHPGGVARSRPQRAEHSRSHGPANPDSPGQWRAREVLAAALFCGRSTPAGRRGKRRLLRGRSVERERWPTDDLQSIRDEFLSLESPAPDDLLAILAACRVLLSNDGARPTSPRSSARRRSRSSAHGANRLATARHACLGYRWQPRDAAADWGIKVEQVVAGCQGIAAGGSAR